MKLELRAFMGLNACGYRVHLLDEDDKVIWHTVPYLTKDSYTYELERGWFRRLLHLKPRTRTGWRPYAGIIRSHGDVEKIYYDRDHGLTVVLEGDGDYPSEMHELVARQLLMPPGTSLRIVTQTMWGVEGYSDPTYRTDFSTV